MIELTEENLFAVDQHLKGLGWLSAAEQVASLSSAGAGNMNRTLRAAITGNQVRSVILKQAVPYVAKYPDIPAPLERAAVEAAFYRCVAATASVAGCMPRLLGTDPANSLMCLEDLGSGSDHSFLYQIGEPHDLDLAPITAWLSDLHQVKTPAPVVNQAMRVLNHEHIFVLPLASTNSVDLPPKLAELQQRCSQSQQLCSVAERLGDIYLNPDHSQNHVLLHGDFYPGSWLLHPTGIRVIDPEFAFTGPAEFDVGVLSAHLVMTGFANGGLIGADELPAGYTAPGSFNPVLAREFAGMEIIRRLFGVAQLPFTFAGLDEIPRKTQWLDIAFKWLGGSP